jgi:hypothetical protein
VAQVIFVFGMEVLIIEVVEQFHECFQDDALICVGVGNYYLEHISREVFEVIMGFVADLDDLFIEGVTAR